VHDALLELEDLGDDVAAVAGSHGTEIALAHGTSERGLGSARDAFVTVSDTKRL